MGSRYKNVLLRVLEHNVPVLDTVAELDWSEPSEFVSALMVTRCRPAMAMRAIRCFLAQSYVSKELVIIDDDLDDTLARCITSELSATDRSQIIYRRLAPSGASLGELRNLSVANARGRLVCQWDDDDFYHPERITAQVAALLATSSDACSLWRHQLLWPESQRLCHSRRRVWEGSLLCYKELMPLYPSLRRGEDTSVVDALLAAKRYVLVDAPRLYTYIVHGTNTWDEAHFEPHWRRATGQYEGERYFTELSEVAAELPPELAREFLAVALPFQ